MYRNRLEHKTKETSNAERETWRAGEGVFVQKYSKTEYDMRIGENLQESTGQAFERSRVHS